MTTAAPTLAEFTAWLDDAQTHALDGMHTTTGEAFTAHLGTFAQVSTAISVVLQFNSAQRASTSTAQTGEAV